METTPTEADESAAEPTATDAAPEGVTVPNITAGAVSGLDHEPLPVKPSQLAGSLGRSNAIPEGQSDPYAGPEVSPDPAPAPTPTVDTTVVGDDPSKSPVGGVDQDTETSAPTPDASASTDQPETSEGSPADDSGEAASGPTTTPEGANDQLQTVTGSAVQGEAVSSDTAGTGEAVNDETGEVTQPGDQLPPIEQTDGTPLPDAEAQSDTERANVPGPDELSDATVSVDGGSPEGHDVPGADPAPENNPGQ